MKQTKKLTLSAMVVALGTVFMIIGAAVEILDLTAVAIASLLVSFVYIELGSPYTFLVWLCTSLTTFLLYSGSMMWLMYFLIFGIYPILKGYIEKLPKRLWWVLKLLFCNVMFFVLAKGTELIFGVPFFEETEFLGLPSMVVKALLWIVMNIMFIAYDMFIIVMVRYYNIKLRPKFSKFLK